MASKPTKARTYIGRTKTDNPNMKKKTNSKAKTKAAFARSSASRKTGNLNSR